MRRMLLGLGLALACAAPAWAAPPAPAGLTATARDSAVDLAWPAVSLARGYNVYRSTSSPVAVAPANRVNAALVTARTFHDAGLANGTRYHYVVTALRKAESGPSPEAAAEPLGTPFIESVSPRTGARDVPIDTAVTANFAAVNPGGGIDVSTLTPANVWVAKKATPTVRIDADLKTDGAGGLIIVRPNACLDPDTRYVLRVTKRLKDNDGAAFAPFTSGFRTGFTGTCSTAAYRFTTTVVQPTAPGVAFTSLAIGPDHKLYAGTRGGDIWRWPILADGRLGTAQVISTLGATQVIGLAFEPGSTATKLHLWVTTNDAAPVRAPDWTGGVARLSGANLQNVKRVVAGLPRSFKDHETNSLAFDPQGRYLYVTQGSMSAMGSPDNTWGDRSEHLLSAAVLRVDYRMLLSGTVSLPYQVGTAHSEDPSLPATAANSYDPFAAGALVRLYADGLRNSFDLVFHSNGALYLPTNGSAGGGNAPGIPPASQAPPTCAKRIDGRPYGGPFGFLWPGGLANLPDQHDFLFRVDPDAASGPYAPGGYYGHPDPARCEWILGAGNPSPQNATLKGARVKQYPGPPDSTAGTSPDANYRGYSYDFGLHASPDGAIEYHSHAFGGSLAGALMIAEYSLPNNVIVLRPDGAGAADPRAIDPVAATIPDLGALHAPLDLVEDPGPDPAAPTWPGRIYVSELDFVNDRRDIVLLTPVSS